MLNRLSILFFLILALGLWHSAHADNPGILGGGVSTGGTSYSLPAATTSALGGVIVGSGLAISTTGVLTASASAPSLSDIIAATTTNSINNAALAQTWLWNSLTTQTALAVTSTSLSSGKLLDVEATRGAATTGYAGYFSNTGTAGYALYAVGNVGYAGASAGATILKATTTASGTVTLPAATDTLVGKATTDTFTNKTFDTAGSGNVFKIAGTTLTGLQGNQAKVQTSIGSTTSGDCVMYDANGNTIDAGAGCGTGGGGIAISSTTSNVDYYALVATNTSASASTVYIDKVSPWKYNPSTGLTSIIGVTTSSLIDAGAASFAGTTTHSGALNTTATATFSGGVYLSAKALEEAYFDNGNTSTAQTVAWNAGNLQKSTITANVVYTFTAPSNPGKFTLFMIENATGGFTITLPTIKWPSGVAPTWSTSANAINILSVIYDGTSYYGAGATNYQ